jgi:hypothetical protein
METMLKQIGRGFLLQLRNPTNVMGTPLRLLLQTTVPKRTLKKITTQHPTTSDPFPAIRTNGLGQFVEVRQETGSDSQTGKREETELFYPEEGGGVLANGQDAGG